MAPRLSDVLIREGLITPVQLEEALRSQVRFGGRLGTNLVKMKMVKESDVVRCLGKQLDMPFVSAERLLSVPPNIIKLIPKEIAKKYKIVPLSLVNNRLTVAMLNPSNLAAIDTISFMTGYIISPAVCSELRILQALEQYYGIRRERRFIALSAPLDPAPLEDLLPDCIDPRGLETAQVDIAATFGFLGLQLDETDIILLEEPAPQISSHAMPSPPSAVTAPTPTAAVQPQQTAPLSPKAPKSVVTEPTDQDKISDAEGYVCRRAERVALFMVKGRMATGCKAILRKNVLDGFENFQLSLAEPSALKVVVDTGTLYLGPISDAAGNRKLMAALGGGAPEIALLIPLKIVGKVVSVLYVDGGNELANDLWTLQDAARLAFDILHPLLFK
ncbi:MAG TPA: hypothetical protein VI298_12645 [Geobacteraceae bacterium]